MEKVKSPEEAVNKIMLAIEEKLEGQEDPILVALDGRSGTGKTTLSKEVAGKVDA